MKEIKAYIRESRVDEVVRALRAAGAKAVTAVRTVSMGSEVDPDFVDISRASPVEHFPPVLKLELVCDDRETATYVDVIREHARTGQRGDGAIFVSSIDDAVRIRTGQRGRDAL